MKIALYQTLKEKILHKLNSFYNTDFNMQDIENIAIGSIVMYITMKDGSIFRLCTAEIFK